MKHLLLSVLTLCLCCLCLPVSANAQAVGSISGRVMDATSAIVPGATVTVRNQGTNAERTVQADSGGNFAFTLLPIGTYTVRVTQPGFQRSELLRASRASSLRSSCKTRPSRQS